MNTDDIIAMRQSGAGLDRMGERWTDEERKEVEEAYFKGEDISQIALQHQRSELAIVKQLDKAGAFCNQGKTRAPKTESCLCYKCLGKYACPVSPENRDKIMCLIREEAHV